MRGNALTDSYDILNNSSGHCIDHTVSIYVTVRIDTLSIQRSNEFDTAPWCIEPHAALRMIHHRGNRRIDLLRARHLEDVILVLEWHYHGNIDLVLAKHLEDVVLVLEWH